MPGGKQPGWHGRGVGLLLVLHVCLDPPHSCPAAASRGETEAPLSCGCCTSLLASAVVSFPPRGLGRASGNGMEPRGDGRSKQTPHPWGVLGREPSPPAPATGSSGWGRCGAGIPRASRPPSRGGAAPTFLLACCRMAWACASWADTRGPLEPASPPPLKRNWWEKTDKAGQGLLSLQLCSVPKSIPVPPAHPINPRVTQLRATQASGSPARRALPARGGTQ